LKGFTIEWEACWAYRVWSNSDDPLPLLSEFEWGNDGSQTCDRCEKLWKNCGFEKKELRIIFRTLPSQAILRQSLLYFKPYFGWANPPDAIHFHLFFRRKARPFFFNRQFYENFKKKILHQFPEVREEVLQGRKLSAGARDLPTYYFSERVFERTFFINFQEAFLKWKSFEFRTFSTKPDFKRNLVYILFFLKTIKGFISQFLLEYKRIKLSETHPYPYLYSFGNPLISVEEEDHLEEDVN